MERTIIARKGRSPWIPQFPSQVPLIKYGFSGIRQILFGVSLFLLGITWGPFSSERFPRGSESGGLSRQIGSLPLQGLSPATNNAEEVAPAGLKMMRMYAKNPWSASVKLISENDLNQSVPSSASKRPRVVVSFTSLPNRLRKHGASTISMLKKQNFHPDLIYINIPKNPLRGQGPYFGKDGEIPSWMAKDQQIRVLRPDRDFGPATKLLPTLAAEKDNPDTIIVTIDDDEEGGWSESTLLGIVAHAMHFPNFAVGLTGWNVTCVLNGAHCSAKDTGLAEKMHNTNDLNMIRQANDYACHTMHSWLEGWYYHCMGAILARHGAFVDVLEGFKGVAYRPRFFDSKVHDVLLSEKAELFKLVDDVWFSGHLALRGVPRIAVFPAVEIDQPAYKRLMSFGRPINAKDEETLRHARENPRGRATAGDIEPGLRELCMPRGTKTFRSEIVEYRECLLTPFDMHFGTSISGTSSYKTQLVSHFPLPTEKERDGLST